MEKGDKNRCEYSEKFSGVNYCTKNDIPCLIKKHNGFKNIPISKVKLPFGKLETLFICDGIMEDKK